jgi:hypothetical protein
MRREIAAFRSVFVRTVRMPFARRRSGSPCCNDVADADDSQSLPVRELRHAETVRFIDGRRNPLSW